MRAGGGEVSGGDRWDWHQPYTSHVSLDPCVPLLSTLTLSRASLLHTAASQEEEEEVEPQSCLDSLLSPLDPEIAPGD